MQDESRAAASRRVALASTASAPFVFEVGVAGAIRFERQERCPCMVEGARPGLTLPEATEAGDRCNKVVRRPIRRPGGMRETV